MSHMPKNCFGINLSRLDFPKEKVIQDKIQKTMNIIKIKMVWAILVIKVILITHLFINWTEINESALMLSIWKLYENIQH